VLVDDSRAVTSAGMSAGIALAIDTLKSCRPALASQESTKRSAVWRSRWLSRCILHPEALGGLLPAPDTTTNPGEIKRQAREHSRSRNREALTNGPQRSVCA
jgi:hypothetical protein